MWDPSRPGSDPVELGRHPAVVAAVAVLPDGRVVGGGDEGRVLIWDLSQPGSSPVELGRHHDGVKAVAVSPDGRVVSGGDDGRLVVWDPSRPGSDPVELGRHESLAAVAVLPDGWVVSGGSDRRVLLWITTAQGPIAQLGCWVVGLAAVQTSHGGASLIVVHAGQGFSFFGQPPATTMKAC